LLGLKERIWQQQGNKRVNSSSIANQNITGSNFNRDASNSRDVINSRDSSKSSITSIFAILKASKIKVVMRKLEI
jgi:hypothetical protein